MITGMEVPMECPVCGCHVEVDDPDQLLVACGCCGAVWVSDLDHRRLDRMLIGAEG